MLNKTDVERQFRDAMGKAGLEVAGELVIGGMERCDVTAKGAHGKGDGRYVLHINANFAAGGFQNFITGGVWQKWSTKAKGWKPSTREQREFNETLERQEREREEFFAAQRAEACARARRLWDAAEQGSNEHPYCLRKRVEPYGLRMKHYPDGDNPLLVPMYDADENLVNLQYIHIDGRKHGLTGGQQGGCHHWINGAKENWTGPIFICEGWADAETVYQATQSQNNPPVIAAFNCDNLPTVAEWVRECYPNAQIIVCADDDWKLDNNPGLTHAHAAARAVGGLIAVPKFGADRDDEFTDFNDLYVTAGLDAVKACIDAASEPEGGDDEGEGGDDEAGDQQKKEKQALTLLKLAPAPPAGGLFRTNDHVGYADIVINEHRETWRIHSTSFRRWLVHQFYLNTGDSPSAEAVRSAIELIEAKAQFDKDVPVREVFVRICGQRDRVYVDLCDEQWRAVEIDAKGWRIIANPPVRFRRAPGMLPLPEPVPGGSLAALRPFVNVKRDQGNEKQVTDSDFVMFVSDLLAALRGTGPYPILKFWGEPGSAKSTLNDIKRNVIDPHKVKRRRLPRDDRDLNIAANNAYVVSYDNVSGIPLWLSNSLCCLSTGGGFGTRALYTDDDEKLFEAMRPLTLNGVDNFPTEHDLAERTIALELPKIPDHERRLEEEFWAAFEAERPRVLGALLDVVAHGLKMLPEVAKEDWPRMADFAYWITACEGALWEAGTFKNAYASNQRKATFSAIDDDPVATALRALVHSERPRWDGYTGELLEKLTASVGNQSKSQEWPKEARALTGRLQRAKASLRRVGITYVYGTRTNKGRPLTIRYGGNADKQRGANDRHNMHDRHLPRNVNDLSSDGQRDRPAPARPDLHTRPTYTASTRPSQSNPLKNNENDGRVCRDGHLRPFAGGDLPTARVNLGDARRSDGSLLYHPNRQAREQRALDAARGIAQRGKSGGGFTPEERARLQRILNKQSKDGGS